MAARGAAKQEGDAAAPEPQAAPDAGTERSGRGKADEAPPFAWVAHEPLFIGDPDASGVAPVRAYNPGDLVPHADVERHGWHGQVHPPDQPAPEVEQPEPVRWQAPEPGWLTTG